ncbi:MAG: hypothetical protein K0R14_639 [Burkholderiales bacterium]|nr:hypothetical protein [Burkholderiales bacterium]
MKTLNTNALRIAMVLFFLQNMIQAEDVQYGHCFIYLNRKIPDQYTLGLVINKESKNENMCVSNQDSIKCSFRWRFKQHQDQSGKPYYTVITSLSDTLDSRIHKMQADPLVGVREFTASHEIYTGKNKNRVIQYTITLENMTQVSARGYPKEKAPKLWQAISSVEIAWLTAGGKQLILNEDEMICWVSEEEVLVKREWSVDEVPIISYDKIERGGD